MSNQHRSALFWFHSSKGSGLPSVTPLSRWQTQDSEFSIYQAKHFTDGWCHSGWEEFLRLIRHNSNAYGRRILIDSHDSKSAIYCASAKYFQGQKEFNGMGEVLFQSSNSTSPDYAVNEGWAKSKEGHRENMLNPAWNYGCGVTNSHIAVFNFGKN